MKILERISTVIRGVGRLLGRRGIRLFLTGAAASVVLSVIEYAIALFLILFLYALGLTSSIKLPRWIPLHPESIRAIWIWAGMLGIALLQSVATVASFQSKILLMETVGARLKMVLAYRLLKKESAHPMPVSEVDFLLSECFSKAAGFVFYFTQSLSFLIQVTLMTAGMLFLAYGEALTGMAGLGLIALVVLRCNRVAQRLSRKVPEAGAQMHRIKTRILRNWMLIKVLRIQEPEYRGFLEAVFSGFRHNALAYLFANMSLALVPVAGVLVLAAIVAANVGVFHTPTAEFAAFLYLFIRMQQRLANGANLMGDLFTARHQFNVCLQMVNGLSPEERTRAFLPEPGFRLHHTRLPWPQDGVSPADEGDAAAAAPPAIVVRDASFCWPNRTLPVFEHLSFTVPAGSQFAIVGPNGCGKSSLLGCLLGLYRPSAGTVTLNGIGDNAHFERHAGRMAYVGPEPYLVHGSVRENLLYGLHAALDDAAIWRALDAVDMEDFIRALPGGLDYTISENGEGLSSGQKQRLTIARAFLRAPTLLVMDEPSTHVDEASEGVIREALRDLKGRCTVIVISHNPEFLRYADHTLTMQAPDAAAAPSP